MTRPRIANRRKTGWVRIGATAILAAVCLLSGMKRVEAETSIVPPRPGQVGFGAQGGYGALVDQGNQGSIFNSGATFAIRVRYRMRYERGVGLSFESQRFDARTRYPYDPADSSSVKPEQLQLIASGLEFYQFFGTRTPTTRMLMVGAGIAQMRTRLNSGEIGLADPTSGDGPYVSAGAGVERFFFRTLAWDLSGRYLATFKDGQLNHNFQAALGLIFYASY